MPDIDFDKSVFINCPFDKAYAPLLEAALFCVTYLGFKPRLANESLEAGQNRLDKIVELIKSCRFSIHDLSICRAERIGDYSRMNMPFELGIDVGFRRGNDPAYRDKKYLIFERDAYDLKRALSDISGQDVVSHKDDFSEVIRHIRDFLKVEAQIEAPGSAKLESEYVTFQGWMMEKKIHEGHSEQQVKTLPTREILDEMEVWVASGKPVQFNP